MSQLNSPAGVLFRSRDLGTFLSRFLRLPEVVLYLVLAAAAAAVALHLAGSLWELLLPPLAVAIVYPFYEYTLHRWVLHLLELCRTRLTARVWWRLHYRHHAEPQDPDVILGSPPSVIIAALLGAWLVALPFGTWAAFAAALAAALAAAVLYEFFHSLAHAPVQIRSRYLLRMRRHHLMHHHIADERNFGVITDIVDQIVGTRVVTPKERSPTAHNLGYTEEVAREYPWVHEIDRDAGSTVAAGADECRSVAEPEEWRARS